MKKNLAFENSFASHPRAKDWSPKNKIEPKFIAKGSSKKYLFDCKECGHEFDAPVNGIVRGRWCIYCAHLKLCENTECNYCFNASFASHPRAEFWSKNNTIDPRAVFKTSAITYLFDCNVCGHEFGLSLARLSAGKEMWCKFCSNTQLCDCAVCHQKSFASHPKAEFWSSNNELLPGQVFKFSNKKFLFDCRACGHEFSADPAHISNPKNPTWCPYCGSHKLCEDEDCGTCFEKSFESHPRSENWSSKNGTIPRDVFKASHTTYMFDCDKCGHEFSVPLNAVTSKDAWCIYCAHLKLCDNEECMFCFDASFASHHKSAKWSSENDITPRAVFKVSHCAYLFDCDICLHTFSMALSDVTRSTKPSWCSYCAHHLLCPEEECDFCFKASFASHPKAGCWSSKNEVVPRDVFKRSAKQYIFDCDRCKKEFKTSLIHVTRKNMPSWCPHCKHKAEAKVYSHLLKRYNVEKEKKFPWCINEETGRHLRFDFLLTSYNLIVEIDGAQHFRQVRNWTNPELSKERDLYKMRLAVENGYTVIRFLQDDVLYDKIEWQTILRQHVKIYDPPELIFISEGKEYEIFLNPQ
jgi:hypothetical protein